MQRYHNSNVGDTVQEEKAMDRVSCDPIIIRPRSSSGSHVNKRIWKSGSSVARNATKEKRTTPKARRDVCSLSNVGASRTAKLIGDSDRLNSALDSRRARTRD
jgi:hypothetical protein